MTEKCDEDEQKFCLDNVFSNSKYFSISIDEKSSMRYFIKGKRRPQLISNVNGPAT